MPELSKKSIFRAFKLSGLGIRTDAMEAVASVLRREDNPQERLKDVISTIKTALERRMAKRAIVDRAVVEDVIQELTMNDDDRAQEALSIGSFFPIVSVRRRDRANFHILAPTSLSLSLSLSLSHLLTPFFFLFSSLSLPFLFSLSHKHLSLSLSLHSPAIRGLLVSAFTLPQLRLDPVRKHFHLVPEASRTLHGTAQDRSAMLRDRFVLSPPSQSCTALLRNCL